MSLNTTVGDSAAEAVASIAEYDAYLLARGVANTTSVTDKENALRSAWASLENLYRDKWVGIRYAEDQALSWPRVDGYRSYAGGVIKPLYDSDGFEILYNTIPRQIKNANIEAARLVIGGTVLEPVLERGGQIKSIGKSVGALRKDIVYADSASAQDRILVIEGLLRGLVTGTPGSTSGNVSLVRG